MPRLTNQITKQRTYTTPPCYGFHIECEESQKKHKPFIGIYYGYAKKHKWKITVKEVKDA